MNSTIGTNHNYYLIFIKPSSFWEKKMIVWFIIENSSNSWIGFFFEILIVGIILIKEGHAKIYYRELIQRNYWVA